MRGSFFERSRSWRSKVKFVFFSVCSPTSPRSLGRSSPNLVGRLRETPDISSRGSFLKVNVIEVKGQISVSPRSLGRYSLNLKERWRAAPDISLRGSFFEKSRSARSKVKFMLFFVCFPTSPRSLGRSSPNLLGRLRAAPDISPRASFLKVKVIDVKGQISVSPRSLGQSSPNLERRWKAAPDISLRGSFFERLA